MDFRIKNYLPLFFTVLGLGLIVIGILNVLDRFVLASGSFIMASVFITTQYRLEINLKEKYYREYVWLLGLKFGDRVKYETMQYFYITKSKKSLIYGQTYKNHYVTGQHFNGYLKFSEDNKILIGDNSSKDWVLKRIKKFNAKLGLEIKDYA